MQNVILDTDISNEVDDRFALTYLMKSIDNLNLQAITIAPFSNSDYAKTGTLGDGTELSYRTACKILDMLDCSDYKHMIYKGATGYFYQSKEMNVAVRKIIELARENEHTTIVAIGAITNVALTIYHAPDIVGKIKVIWLGGNSFLSEKNDEYNFKQDIEAVRAVFDSGAELVVIPCRNVAVKLLTTVYELEHYIGKSGEIGKYLCDIFAHCKDSFRTDELDKVAESKTLWDLSAIGYLINPAWFTIKKISAPEILDDTSYKFTQDKHQISFVIDLSRHKIYQDFFLKMGYIPKR